jgi:hypothetical protein
MGPNKSENIETLITLTMITLSGFHSILKKIKFDFCLELFVSAVFVSGQFPMQLAVLSGKK